MICPECGGKTFVRDSRPVYDGSIITRRRECRECSTRFTTCELWHDAVPEVSVIANIMPGVYRSILPVVVEGAGVKAPR